MCVREKECVCAREKERVCVCMQTSHEKGNLGKVDRDMDRGIR